MCYWIFVGFVPFGSPIVSQSVCWYSIVWIRYLPILCPIEMADSRVTFDVKILKNSRCFWPRRAVGFDRAGGAIESYCPSGSKTSQNFHVESDATVRHFDGLRYIWRPIIGWLYCFAGCWSIIATQCPVANRFLAMDQSVAQRLR